MDIPEGLFSPQLCSTIIDSLFSFFKSYPCPINSVKMPLVDFIAAMCSRQLPAVLCLSLLSWIGVLCCIFYLTVETDILCIVFEFLDDSNSEQGNKLVFLFVYCLFCFETMFQGFIAAHRCHDHANSYSGKHLGRVGLQV